MWTIANVSTSQNGTKTNMYVYVCVSLSNSMREKEYKIQGIKRKKKNKIKGLYLFPPWAHSFPEKQKETFAT